MGCCQYRETRLLPNNELEVENFINTLHLSHLDLAFVCDQLQKLSKNNLIPPRSVTVLPRLLGIQADQKLFRLLAAFSVPPSPMLSDKIESSLDTRKLLLLAVFVCKSSWEAKAKALFDLYDTNKTRDLKYSEMCQLVTDCYHFHLKLFPEHVYAQLFYIEQKARFGKYMNSLKVMCPIGVENCLRDVANFQHLNEWEFEQWAIKNCQSGLDGQSLRLYLEKKLNSFHTVIPPATP